ncbi:alpha/beta hydrolase [Phenylobacterium sp. LjRoot219]|uniref:alpha/beta hydrolase n=1 Tax=Phenylobacterium sp. LjRoot219 TaxID=3342283 RepID=UPI003ECF8B43
MATYVLVHGGGGGGWVWGRLAPRLRAAGHEVYTPTLTGVGERSHLLRADTDLETHLADILGVLFYEDLRDVILVGHSYGGMVITGVADRAPDRIGQLVYLDAATPQDGESLVDLSPVLMALARQDARMIDGVEVVLGPDAAATRQVGSQDDAIRAWKARRQTPHPWISFAQPLRLTNAAALARIPRTNINCTSTLAMRPKDKVQRALTADRVWEIDTTHDLMITEPQRVAEMLLSLADL